MAILLAECGAIQAAAFALSNPEANVVGIDVGSASLRLVRERNYTADGCGALVAAAILEFQGLFFRAPCHPPPPSPAPSSHESHRCRRSGSGR